jgi:hypothetical protein
LLCEDLEQARTKRLARQGDAASNR